MSRWEKAADENKEHSNLMRSLQQTINDNHVNLARTVGESSKEAAEDVKKTVANETRLVDVSPRGQEHAVCWCSCVYNECAVGAAWYGAPCLVLWPPAFIKYSTISTYSS